MRRTMKKGVAVVLTVMTLVVLSTAVGGDVRVKEGVIIGDKFQGTTCTASGASSVSLGWMSEAPGAYSMALGNMCTAGVGYDTAIGYDAEASGILSTSIGWNTTASAPGAMALGYQATASSTTALAAGCDVTASQAWATAMGRYCENDVSNSFAVGYGTSQTPSVDFRVVGGQVFVYNDLYVVGLVDCDDVVEHSSFYDASVHGRALDYVEDSSRTIDVGVDGRKQYNHEADPAFLQTRVMVKDYDSYAEEEFPGPTGQPVRVRVYATHEEVRSSLGMKVAWLRQCIYESKQENEALRQEIDGLKARLAALEAAVQNK